MTRAVFAIPGDKDRRTGGFLYEATVLRVLNEIGVKTAHLQLPDSFPDPTVADMAETLAALNAVPAHQPIILDGLVFGAIDPAGLAQVKAPILAMIHHPLGLETGLAPERAAFLCENEAQALGFAAHIVVPSPHTAEVLARDFGADPASITVAPPGFDRPVLNASRADPPLILSVGLLARRKGHDVLLDALSLITDLHWNAVIVGKAHDQHTANALRTQCRELGLSQRVTFAGELDGPELAEHFNAASIFALATRYEGYGMVLSEAMFYGLPVVSCDVGAVPETVGEAGILVPPDDPAAFANALRRLIEEPEIAAQFQQLSLERAKSLPSWRDTARVFERVIRQVS
ncbi:glycosyltransferase family 4 protein [Litoreibacter arenae]|uniref:Glycosyl transferase, group 1 n=1 Tax=Litoreibacter arenae DSM 19593 TaxID=1123360 RepID=S9QAU7_9RHOB|nr:glycosyltransferase family 4 protein [Litoreibacter arenae]EPX77077.1 Glycosyl transferase, group 1 [Litoreibacter arenae DSM 19593]